MPSTRILPAHPRLCNSVLSRYYAALFRCFGPQHWWPARSRFEVIVGAILVQNTAWANVARAIGNLRREKLLAPSALQRVSLVRLSKLIRPSGYFRQKARKLKAFLQFLCQQHRGSLTRMLRTPAATLREQLLGVHGIGRETADSILLYAGNRPVFVIDAYTRRILERHNLAHAKDSYEHLRALFEQNLPAEPPLFNEYHALLVQTGKHFCFKHNPDCAHCPLLPFLPLATRHSPLLP